MDTLKKTARTAGVLYLLLVLTGMFGLIYTPSKLIVPGNATETASNILAHQTLFRVDLVVGLASLVIFIALVLVLYLLFREVSGRQSTLMVILVLVQVPYGLASLLVQVGAFELVSSPDFLTVLDKPQREALAMLCLHVNELGLYLISLFWGLWLFPLGWLVYRSGFLPRFLGVWLIINGAAYVALSSIGVLAPEYADNFETFATPALLGEVILMLWLLTVGVRPKAAVVQGL